jgi:hypothetical protein
MAFVIYFISEYYVKLRNSTSENTASKVYFTLSSTDMHIFIIPSSSLQSQRFDMAHLNGLFSIKSTYPAVRVSCTRDIAMFVVVRMGMNSVGFAI